MTRSVRAILIGAPNTAGKLPVPDAVDVVTTIKGFLAKRFAGKAAITALVDKDATHAKVIDELTTARDAVSDGELFMLLFAGHGTKATDEEPFQSWSLKGHDRFTDVELSQQLLGFSSKIDTVVISACCYGAGLFKPGPFKKDGPKPGPHLPVEDLNTDYRLRLFNQHRVSALLTTFVKKNAPMVCISAAEREDEVNGSKLHMLADDIVAAADAHQSYQQLEHHFETTGAADRLFQVDARPSTRMSDEVLGSQ